MPPLGAETLEQNLAGWVRELGLAGYEVFELAGGAHIIIASSTEAWLQVNTGRLRSTRQELDEGVVFIGSPKPFVRRYCGPTEALIAWFRRSFTPAVDGETIHVLARSFPLG